MDSHLVRQALEYHGEGLGYYMKEEQGIDPGTGRLPQSSQLSDTHTYADEDQRDSQFNQRLLKFIAKKADLLYQETDEYTRPSSSEIDEDDFCAIMPPMETFMGIPPDCARYHYFNSLEKRDVVIGVVSSVLDSGLVVTLLCMDKDKCRDLDNLKITAFCPVKELPKDYGGQSPVDAFQVKDKVRAVVISVNPETEKIILSLLKKSLPPDMPCPKLGVINDDEFPVYYRRHLQIHGVTYDELLHSIMGFNNSFCVPYLMKDLGVEPDPRQPSSLLRSLSSLKIPPSEMADALRKAQSAKWAMKSVKEGVAYFKAGKSLEAMQMLNKALQVDVDNVEALVARGALYANNESYSKAIEDFNASLKINPNHGNARKYLLETLIAKGRELHDYGRYEEAEGYYDKALEINRSDPEVIHYLRLCQRHEPVQVPRKGSHRGDSDREDKQSRTSSQQEFPLSQTKERLKRLIEEDERGQGSKRLKLKHGDWPSSPVSKGRVRRVSEPKYERMTSVSPSEQQGIDKQGKEYDRQNRLERGKHETRVPHRSRAKSRTPDSPDSSKLYGNSSSSSSSSSSRSSSSTSSSSGSSSSRSSSSSPSPKMSARPGQLSKSDRTFTTKRAVSEHFTKEMEDRRHSRDSSERHAARQNTSRGSSERCVAKRSTSRGSHERLIARQNSPRDSSERYVGRLNISRGSRERHVDRHNTSRDSSERHDERSNTSRNSSKRHDGGLNTSRDSNERHVGRLDTSRDSSERHVGRLDTSRDSSDRHLSRHRTSRDSGERHIARHSTSRDSSERYIARQNTPRNSSERHVGRLNTSRDSSERHIAKGKTSREAERRSAIHQSSDSQVMGKQSRRSREFEGVEEARKILASKRVGNRERGHSEKEERESHSFRDLSPPPAMSQVKGSDIRIPQISETLPDTKSKNVKLMEYLDSKHNLPPRKHSPKFVQSSRKRSPHVDIFSSPSARSTPGVESATATTPDKKSRDIGSPVCRKTGGLVVRGNQEEMPTHYRADATGAEKKVHPRDPSPVSLRKGHPVPLGESDMVVPKGEQIEPTSNRNRLYDDIKIQVRNDKYNIAPKEGHPDNLLRMVSGGIEVTSVTNSGSGLRSGIKEKQERRIDAHTREGDYEELKSDNAESGSKSPSHSSFGRLRNSRDRDSERKRHLPNLPDVVASARKPDSKISNKHSSDVKKTQPARSRRSRSREMHWVRQRSRSKHRSGSRQRDRRRTRSGSRSSSSSSDSGRRRYQSRSRHRSDSRERYNQRSRRSRSLERDRQRNRSRSRHKSASRERGSSRRSSHHRRDDRVGPGRKRNRSTSSSSSSSRSSSSSSRSRSRSRSDSSPPQKKSRFQDSDKKKGDNTVTESSQGKKASAGSIVQQKSALSLYIPRQLQVKSSETKSRVEAAKTKPATGASEIANVDKTKTKQQLKEMEDFLSQLKEKKKQQLIAEGVFDKYKKPT